MFGIRSRVRAKTVAVYADVSTSPPDQHDWNPDYHVGGNGGSVPKQIRPQRVFTRELESNMFTTLHIWFLPDHPQYGDRDYLELIGQSGDVYYERQGRDFVREINASLNPRKVIRVERDAYRSRLLERTAPIEEFKGKMLRQRSEFNMFRDTLATVARRNIVCEHLRLPGAKPTVRTSKVEEPRLGALRDWIRSRIEWKGDERLPAHGKCHQLENTTTQIVGKRKRATQMDICVP